MSILFEDRITPAGKQAIQYVIDFIAVKLKEAIEAHGEDSPEAAQLLLAFISIDQIAEPREDAHAGIERYLAMSEKIYGPDSVETANGFLILGWSHLGLERKEEGRVTMGRALSLPEGKRAFPPIEPMLEVLCEILDKFQNDPKPEHTGLPLVLGVLTLSWLVTYCSRQSPPFPVFTERLRPVLESRGFAGDTWEWLMRRCNRADNHLVGLISILIEEGMVPPEDSSKEFPLTVAEGELSLRVERLLAEGRRSLSTTGELSTAILVFPDPSKGRPVISVSIPNSETERPLLHDKLLRAALLDRARKNMTRFGANSVMVLDWVEVHLPGSTDEDITKALLVLARDAKSCLEGIQLVRQVDEKYVFDEPIVRVAEDGWFYQFTSSVKPARKSPRRKEEKPKTRARTRK
ncbi:MAG: hypothetical protein HY912_08945 [Desulfomonile tiedjei]|uniref:Uncharacterized protein n=1 Tax=Desulfomonile tiedjei TaxID=2358 RepID=A0A9D6V0E4_9BACT|nr:hypothetical protein [Desulfomonile tiedjei]